MLRNAYHFVTHWRVEGTVEEVSEIFDNPLDLVRWWPSVYLEAQEMQAGDDRGVGRVISLHTKGWLPYTLRWQFQVAESRAPFGYTLEARGDFVGRGIWTFEQDGSCVDITYDWQTRAEKPFLKYLSLVLKPVFAANHRWAMEQGERSLSLELERRRLSPGQRRHVALPPGPTSSIVFGGTALLVVLLLILIWLAVGRAR